MPYYTRVFCTSALRPSLSELELTLQQTRPRLALSSSEAGSSEEWRQAECTLGEDGELIMIECDVRGEPNSLVAEECEEFIAELGITWFSPSKRRVAKHLRRAHYVVSCQLLRGAGANGLAVSSALMQYFVSKYGGLVQSDGEGFYEGSKVVVALK